MRVLAEVLAAVAECSEQEGAAGLLVGLEDGSTTIVVTALHCDADDLATTAELAGALLPPPLAVVGCYGPAGSAVVQKHTPSGGVAATYTPGKDGDGASAVQLSVKQGGTLVGCQPQVVAAADCCTADGLLRTLAEQYIPVRCTADVVLTASRQAGNSCRLQPSLEDLEQQLFGPDTAYIAEVPAADGGGDAAAAGQQPATALPGKAPFASLGASWSRVVQLRPMQRAGGPGAGAAAPRLAWQPGAATLRHCSLCLDVLCYVPVGMPAEEAVGSIVRPAVARQLAAMLRQLAAMLHQLEEAGTAGASVGVPNLPPQQALHFRPPGFVHHVTLLYPLAKLSTEPEEEGLIPRRKALHRLLGLPANRPLLRVANAVDWALGGGAGGGAGSDGLAAALAAGGTGGKARLSDVHEGLGAPPVGGSVHFVQGTYDYYHYMQDKFDDSGWGCAYRSLQTICSWFARQGYATRPPPSHREVQAALVQMGDKQAPFLGSRQWIGAIEIGYVLDSLLGVQHRVLSVGSGDDMPSLARQIAHHFDTQGTPIMIGGGVLAYTLLGIDFDERSGRCAFLILDPHYTGAEDVRKIHAGQWVAWKQPGDKAAAGGDLFVSGSFYNLLCPQRPTTV